MHRLSVGVCAAIAGLGAVPAAHAQGLVLDEVRFGGAFHNVYQGFLPTSDTWNFSTLSDVKFSALFAAPDVDAFTWLGAPRVELGTTIDLEGFDENVAHANLNWQVPVFDTPLYLEAGFGAAVTNGALSGAERPQRNFGCALNFFETAGIGANLSDTATLTVRYEHTSNLELCSPNDGLSNLTITLGAKF